MNDEVRTGAGAAAYRGFLFSDMRGFTAFAERHGNTAAAALVGRFLDIAREAIARHDGAEVKTEGDAIHAVFPSASAAVLCGLEIVDAAADLNAREPDHPLGLGVGVHAGEAVETAEGYIGRAVNIAARLCAAAKPGEVLVSSTVKGITHSSIPVGFIPRGRRRLKGIQDPIQVYAVTRDTSARTPREVPRPVLLGGAGLAVAVLVAVAALAGSQLMGNPAATAGVSQAPASGAMQPVVIGPLDIGAYRSQQFRPAVSFVIDDLDWTANRDAPGVLGLVRDQTPRGSVYFLRVQGVITNPCTQEGTGAEQAPSALSLLTQLENLRFLVVSERVPVTVAGLTGQQVDIDVQDSVLAACGGLVGGDVPLLIAGDEIVGFSSGERFRLITVEVEDQAVTILMSTDWTQTPSVQELIQLLELGKNIVDSVDF